MRIPKRTAAGIAGVMFALSACSLATDTPSTSDNTFASASPNASEQHQAKKKRQGVEAAAEASASASQAVEYKEAQAFDKKVRAQKSVDDKLSIIVTEFCRVARRTSQYEHLSIGTLSVGFEHYWQAGRWNYPLREAVKQKGGCPSLANAPL